MLVSTKVLSAWEAAYRRYGRASDDMARSPRRDVRAVRELTDPSRAVDFTWRAITSDPQLPWWVVAAVSSAAEAFEEQASKIEAETSPAVRA